MTAISVLMRPQGLRHGARAPICPFATPLLKGHLFLQLFQLDLPLTSLPSGFCALRQHATSRPTAALSFAIPMAQRQHQT